MLKILRRITQEVSAAENLAAALRIVVEQVQEAIAADVCSVFLADEEHAEYVLVATVGHTADAIGRLRIPFGKGLVGFIAEREEPVNLDDIHKDTHFYPNREFTEDHLHGYLGVPIIFSGALLGVMVAQHHDQVFFTEDEEAFLVTLAIQLSAQLSFALSRGALSDAFPKRKRRRKTEILNGVPGSVGVGIGQALAVYPVADLEAVPDRAHDDAAVEIKHFKTALDRARQEIYALQLRAQSSVSHAESALFDVYLRILDSRSLLDDVTAEIESGQWAQGALRRVIKRHVIQFESIDDEYLRERASDFKDLGRRILGQLQSYSHEALVYPKNTILVSDELSATELMEVPEGLLKGVISGAGSNNSHVAILARALGVPAVMGVNGAQVSQIHDKEVIVDGYNGHVYVMPTPALKKEFKGLAREEQQLDEELDALRELPAKTTDGHSVSLLVNTGLAAEAGLSLSVGAEGVGLYRTEMPFMVRTRFPSEEEQRIMYKQLLSTFSPRTVVMRSLDVGGDKALPYFSITEENPFLGWRGVRITLDQPEIFLQQIRAMLHASVGLKNLSIMLPMVSAVSDIDDSKRLITQAFNELKDEGLKIHKPPLGIMIEVPSAVYQAYDMAKRVDFLSVGTNDLIQYLLAVDRNNPRVADRYDGLHPAVIRALKQIVDAGHRASKPVGICGELASDPLAAVLLLGMGYDSLSMNARGLPRVKSVVRSFSLEEAKSLVAEVLKMDDAKEVRNHMESAIDDVGLGGLIRAGK
jgi:phosphotransferase system, enzyme I, PtsP